MPKFYYLPTEDTIEQRVSRLERRDRAAESASVGCTAFRRIVEGMLSTLTEAEMYHLEVLIKTEKVRRPWLK